MEGYEIYRLSDEEIQHFGVKGMKWGKRKSRSAYMRKVDAHETKTKSVAAAKSTASSAKRKAYMDAVRANDNKGKAIRDAKAKEKSDKKSANSYMDKVRAHENKTKAVAAAKSESGKAKRKAYMDAVNAHEQKGKNIANAKSKEKLAKKQISESIKTSKLKENYTKSIEADKSTVKNVADKVLGKELSDRNATYLKNAAKAKKQLSPEERAAKTLKRKESLKKAGEVISYMSKVAVTATIDDQIRNEISDPTLQEYAKAGARAKIDEAWRVK